jgi:hypothetical protein
MISIKNFQINQLILLACLIFPIFFTSCTSTNKNIIINPITGEKVLVANQDFDGKLKWEDAQIRCKDLGEGWRLPNIEELKVMFQKRGELVITCDSHENNIFSNHYKNNIYFSSSYENRNQDIHIDCINSCSGALIDISEQDYCKVRAVKTIK